MTLFIIFNFFCLILAVLMFLKFIKPFLTKEKRYMGRFFIKAKSGHVLTIQITGPTSVDTANLTNHIKELLKINPNKTSFNQGDFDEVMDYFDKTMHKFNDVFKRKFKYDKH